MRIQTAWRHNAEACCHNLSSLATAQSAKPLPCRVPLNGMFHQDSATQWNKVRSCNPVTQSRAFHCHFAHTRAFSLWYKSEQTEAAGTGIPIMKIRGWWYSAFVIVEIFILLATIFILRFLHDWPTLLNLNSFNHVRSQKATQTHLLYDQKLWQNITKYIYVI